MFFGDSVLTLAAQPVGVQVDKPTLSQHCVNVWNLWLGSMAGLR